MFKYSIISSIILSIYFFIQCKVIKNSYYTIKNKRIPKLFNNYKIVQLSDLHNCFFGTKKHNYLLSKIDKIRPDLILLTGDFFEDKPCKNTMLILEELSRKYKICFVSGGHEFYVRDYEKILEKLSSLGIELLDNKRIKIEKNSEFFYITGLLDPIFYKNNYRVMKNNLKKYESDESFHILLSHRPDLFDLYTSYKYDLSLTGHAHGGQIRIGNQGLFAPNQDWFPKYSAGIFTKNDRSMIVNRGIGWHSLFIKINNRPEIGVIILKNEN